MKTLDKVNVVPLYEQVMSDIREKIRSKVYAEGDRIPSEMELCEKFNVSRITVRRAINDLVEEGYLERRHGKGTFVTMKLGKVTWVSVDGELTHGFSEVKHTVSDRRIIAKREYESTAYEQELLQIAPGEKVLILERLVTQDGVPILEIAEYPASRYPGFLSFIEDNTSTYQVLQQRYGMTRKRMTRELSLAYATEEQAQLVSCTAGSPLFKVVKVLYDNDDIPVHFSILYYRGDMTVFQLDR